MGELIGAPEGVRVPSDLIGARAEGDTVRGFFRALPTAAACCNPSAYHPRIIRAIVNIYIVSFQLFF